MMRMTFGRLWHRLAALLGYLLLAALFYVPILLGARTFPDGDFTHHFLPFSLFQQAAIRNGQLPLWNPYTYSGHPFLADIQAAVFYPLSNLLLLLTLPWDGPGARLYWLQVEAMIHIALAGWFTFLLVKQLTRSRWAAFVAGCAFAFSGYLTGYPPLQLAILRTAIWLPLLLWLILRAMQMPTQWRWWIGASLVYTTIFFAGHPQTFLHSSYVLGLWMLWLLGGGIDRAIDRASTNANEQDTQPVLATAHPPHSPRHQLGVHILGLTLFFILALALSAAQLLPSLELTQLSVRANVDYAYVSGGFPLQDTWQLLLPGVLTQFSPLYIGIIGLALALVGAVTGRRSAQFFLLLTLLFLLLSYGEHGFLYPLFYRFAPGWQLFRGQERAAFVVALALSVLAGYGAAALPSLPYWLRRLLAVTVAVLISAGVYTFGVFWQLPGQSAVSQIGYLAIALGTILLALVLVVVMVLPGWDRRRAVVLTAALLLNLFVVNMGTNLANFGPVRTTILAPEMAALQGAVAQTSTGATDGEETLAGRAYNEFRIYEDYGMRLGVEDVWGSSPLRLARYAALFENFPLDRMWRLTGVETVLTWRRELFVPSQLLAAFPQVTDTTYLHRLTPAAAATAVNPRAWMVTQLHVAEDAAALTALADHAIDLSKVAFLPPPSLTSNITLPAGDDAVMLARRSPQALRVHLQSEMGGLLLISENWMPGWAVTDFRCLSTTPACTRTTSADELPLLTPLRADLTLIGIVVPPGEMTFTLRYQPRSVMLGLTISALALLLLLLLLFWRWRRQVTR